MKKIFKEFSYIDIIRQLAFLAKNHGHGEPNSPNDSTRVHVTFKNGMWILTEMSRKLVRLNGDAVDYKNKINSTTYPQIDGFWTLVSGRAVLVVIYENTEQKEDIVATCENGFYHSYTFSGANTSPFENAPKQA